MGARFYGDEEDPPRAGQPPSRVRYYTASQLERAYIETVRYAQSLEEFIADHFEKQHRNIYEVHA